MSFDWPIVRDGCLPALPVLPDPPSDDEQAAYDVALAQRNAAEDLATTVMWALSGRQFGLREVIVRPGRVQGWPCAPYSPLWDGWSWTHTSCGCTFHCGHSTSSVVHLPGPVTVDTDHPVVIKLGGIILDPAAYTVEGDLLYRRNDGVWPTQNLARPLDEAGTWSVTYWQGIPVPSGVDRLTGLLAAEFILACTGEECRIPRTVTQTSTRGVTNVYDPAAILAAGKTGIPEIDLWLASVNPNHLYAAPEVL